ncbi:MAG: OmpA/MotB domain protein [Sphingobacteriales bacterium]|nr:OmpA/MotB domain protein [Sphingobacteriales bacterium]
MRIRILIILILFLVQGSLQKTFAISFNDDAVLKRAIADYEKLNFVAAIKGLKVVLQKNSRNVLAQELIANSYRNIRNYDEALFWYSELVKQPSLKQEWVIHYAEALANKERYEESEQWYRKYQRLAPKDQRTIAFIKAGINKWSQESAEWKVSSININTSASEYSPIYYNGGLLFSSNRPKPSILKHVFGWDQTPFSDLYVVENLDDVLDLDSTKHGDKIFKKHTSYKYNDDDTEMSSNDSRTLGNMTLKLDDSVNFQEYKAIALPLKGKVNTRFHEGAPLLLPDGSLMFTRNNFYNGKAKNSQRGINKLKLFTATGLSLNHIENFPYNSDEYSVGHPAISADGNTLIFASDMPGSYGGTDLFYSTRLSSGRPWSKPTNMGRKINTEGNELFPYWDKSGKLFFSSTGHPGFGGLDIFETSLKNMKVVGTPHNLGVPFNSSVDDFGFIRSDDENSGFFSSNRSGNDDIYSFKRITYAVKLEGLVIDPRTSLPVGGSKVLLKHGKFIDTITTDSKGAFNKDLLKQMDYEVTAKNPGYFSNSIVVTTTGIETDSVINVVLKLDKPDLSQQYVLNNCDSLKRAFSVESIYYDLDKWDIRPDARPALNELVELMKTYPNIKLISASHTDTRASDTYNKALSLRRGQSAKNYLVSKGINANRIRIEYYGKSRLVNNCKDDVPCTEDDQQLNRRTEFEVLLNGVNLSQLDCDI